MMLCDALLAELAASAPEDPPLSDAELERLLVEAQDDTDIGAWLDAFAAESDALEAEARVLIAAVDAHLATPLPVRR